MRTVIDPRGVCHNPSTLVARTIQRLEVAGRSAAGALAERYEQEDGTINVSDGNSDWTDQEWMQHLETVAPVRYLDCPPHDVYDDLEGLGADDEWFAARLSARTNPSGKVMFTLPMGKLRPLVNDLLASGLWALDMVIVSYEGEHPWWYLDQARAGV